MGLAGGGRGLDGCAGAGGGGTERRAARPGAGGAAAAAVVVAGYLPHVLAVGVKVLGYLPGYLREENYDSGGRYLLASLLHLPVVPAAAVAGAGPGRGRRLGPADPAARAPGPAPP